MTYAWRPPTVADHEALAPLIDAWWGGRAVQQMLPRLFFAHFSGTSLVVRTASGQYAAFVVAFVSADTPERGYIHFVGVHPEHRGAGLGAELYRRTFQTLSDRGCTTVSAVTSPVNTGSIAFHTRLGFEPVTPPGAADARTVTVWRDYDGPGEDRVVFQRSL